MQALGSRGHADSWYAASVPEPPVRAPLEGDTRADVGILGAGYTGLSTALRLAVAGYRVTLLEAERVGWGASGRNGGQVLPGFGCGEHALETLLGRDDARHLFAWSLEGMATVRDTIAGHGIACDWRDGHATVAVRARQWRELQAWQATLAQHYAYPLALWDITDLPAHLDSPRYVGGVFDARAGHLHPLAYALGLARVCEASGVRVHEHSAVTRLEHGSQPVLHTAHGRLRCDAVVLAGNALVAGIAPALDRRIMPVGTYIGATRPLDPALVARLIPDGIAVADNNWALDYFRFSADHRLLFGGRASYSNREPRRLRAVMRARMARVFPALAGEDFNYLWGGVIDISRNRAPDWGRIAPNVYYAQGFSGHGIAATALAGQVLAEAIRGQGERLDVFARIRHRDFPGGRRLRTPLLVAAMSWFKLRDALW